MKTRILFFLTILAAGVFSCSKDKEVKDPVYEFVFFTGEPSVSINEFSNSETAYPLVVQLAAFKPYPTDIDLTLEITGHNATENVDFTVLPDNTLIIKAGKLVSDTLYIKSIDNASGTDVERTFDIKITSVSKSDIKIGLGIGAPKNAMITVKILDDECSKTTDIFNSANLSNHSIGHGKDGILPATGVVTGNTVTLTGDLINYSTFSAAALTVTLTPEEVGSTKGTAAFGEQETGTDGDGYDYKFIQTGEGTYDVCNGTISLAYDVYYMDGDWVLWYSSTNVISAP